MSSERQAFNDGFDKGYEKARERIAQLESSLVEAQQAFEEERARLHFLMEHHGHARFTWPDGTTIFLK